MPHVGHPRETIFADESFEHLVTSTDVFLPHRREESFEEECLRFYIEARETQRPPPASCAAASTQITPATPPQSQTACQLKQQPRQRTAHRHQAARTSAPDGRRSRIRENPRQLWTRGRGEPQSPDRYEDLSDYEKASSAPPAMVVHALATKRRVGKLCQEDNRALCIAGARTRTHLFRHIPPAPLLPPLGMLTLI